MEIGYRGDTQACLTPGGIGGKFVQPSIEDRLLQRKNALESDLNDVNAALEALQSNPEVLKIMCLISKVNY